jgi:hypothetical protein
MDKPMDPSTITRSTSASDPWRDDFFAPGEQMKEFQWAHEVSSKQRNGDASRQELLGELQRRIDAHQQEVRGRERREQNNEHRVQVSESREFYRAGATLAKMATQEVGVILGKISSLAIRHGIKEIVGLTDDLLKAIEDQYVTYFTEMRQREHHGSLVEAIAPYKTSHLMRTMFVSSPGGVTIDDVATARESGKRSSSPQAKPPMPDERRSHSPTAAPKLSLAEAVSTTTAMLAESLATSLQCRLVRIYIKTHNELKTAASYPFRELGKHNGLDFNTSGLPDESPDPPLLPAALEKVLLKSLKSAVLEKGIAIHGQDTKALMADVLRNQPNANTFLKSCLAWPVFQPSGIRRISGMILAINKEGPTPDDARKFTSDDEYTMKLAAKMLGCMTERYPAELFAADCGGLIHRYCHPDRLIKPHIPFWITEEVNAAQRIANDALRHEPTTSIFRGPLQAMLKIQARDKTNAEEFKVTASSIVGVEYSIEAMTDLWKSGYDENVAMHHQYRQVTTKLRDLQSIVKSFLEAVVVARNIKQFEELVMYLRSMELLLRGENAKLFSEHIQATMEQLVRSNPKEPQPPNPSELEALYRRRMVSSMTSVAVMHIDGPENVRSYTCDPETKRQQVHAIEKVVECGAVVPNSSAQSPKDTPMARLNRPTMSSSARQRLAQQFSHTDLQRHLGGARMDYTPNSGTKQTPFRLHPPSDVKASSPGARKTPTSAT